MHKAKTGVGCDGFHTKSPFGLNKRNERKNCGILRESGTEWQVVATSLHNDVLLASEECHEWKTDCAGDCAGAIVDTLV